MSNNRAQQITAALVLLVQSWQVPAGTYAGVSGLDSLARSMCTLVDQTVGLLLFYGLVSLSFYTESEKVGLARLNLVHTTRPGESLKSTTISYRARWVDIGNLGSRSGNFTVESTKGGLPVNGRDVESQELDTSIAPNANHWVYPYLLDWKPRENGGSLVPEVVVLTRRGLIKTTAVAIARFAIFLATSLIITLLHITMVAPFFDDKVVKIVFILADIGRWGLVVGQLSSIMTYSLNYKGVSTWASPKAFKESDEYGGGSWCTCDQKLCRDFPLAYMGRAYHAKAVFYVCEFLWPRITKIMPAYGSHIWGTTIFSSFKCFDESSFTDEQSTVLRLNISPRGRGDLSNDFIHRGEAIDFKVPTVMVQLCFPTRLRVKFVHRMTNFFILGPFCLCSIAIPFLVIWRDGGPSTAATIFLGVVQAVTFILGFKDINNWSINCKFELDEPQHGIPHAAHSYPPRRDNLGGATQGERCACRKENQQALLSASSTSSRSNPPSHQSSVVQQPTGRRSTTTRHTSSVHRSTGQITGPNFTQQTTASSTDPSSANGAVASRSTG
ncbi:hypothetical protein D9757_004497 [Collybiopsis confluens]|uniref:Uncharacterized protein n=1 Tax=Collybiopsis confluens TaxID=2823264 RepID=A0A8H5HWK0_9AGAR|nr:hypothetical protein D9757_004497 [Collybiopsis confluens]